ncbi:thiamine pyrophosphate enzyme, central domain protein [Paenibacillus macerans]|uniref:Thiamine pyrophosphate enzyme, central domain protein n=2 Tax=Paenibacillus macerans TaxID=44252 RepID=A0A090ZAR2_PAEMA|nr:thiamine pyrophosphate enzyme, central domain protein [Paenibacillus macerans]
MYVQWLIKLNILRVFEPMRIANQIAGQSQIRQAANLMLKAKRPVILAGNRPRLACDAIRELADRWGCAIVMSYGAKGMLADPHPYLLGGLGEGGNPLASDYKIFFIYSL